MVSVSYNYRYLRTALLINKHQLIFTESYEKCVLGEDATRIEMNWNTLEATLVYNDSAFINTKCCYSEILRAGSGKTADEDFLYVFYDGFFYNTGNFIHSY